MQKKRSLLRSMLSLLLCISMLIGSTFAWFTDSEMSAGNVIAAGNLDIKMYWTDDLSGGTWHSVNDAAYNTIFSHDNWEPGYTDVKYIKLVNEGDLALNYQLTITPVGAVGKLAEVIQVYCAKDGLQLASRKDLNNMTVLGLLSDVMNGGATASGTLPAKQNNETIITFAMSMITTAGNTYQGESVGDGFTVTALATQHAYEEDSFGSSYDADALQQALTANRVSVPVTPVGGKVPAGGVVMQGKGVTAAVPEGVALEDGADTLTLTITPLDKSASGISVAEEEILIPVDVHIDGVSDSNTTPIIIDLGAVMPKALNMGNYTIVHVENGVSHTMTYVPSGELTAHNQFTYDPVTGNVTVALATFSEVALVANTENAWNGSVATGFAGGDGTEENPYIIANADQLAYLGDRVSNDNANYGDKHYKLIADINIGGSDNYTNNGVVWYPIGYQKLGEGANKAGETEWYTYGGAFRGVFDGMGHTVTGIYQTTWVMDGNYDYGYYKAAMGLFGYVYDGTIKNLTVDNFQSVGEYAPTGCVAAYAAGEAAFENISITNSHPQTYNTGVAGIVGWDNGGDTQEDASALSFRNITVDRSNTISALWGSWDVAAAGILGYLGHYSTVDFENCNVSAVIDVYNDVCGNYQYYWYRYCGMMVGTVDRTTSRSEITIANEEDMILSDGEAMPAVNARAAQVIDMTGITAKNCKVNFGEWNDYYYCELKANSLASYTHDHQFSRLTQISSESDIYDGANWTKSGNFVILTREGENAITECQCYHIVEDENGDLVRHLHEDAGTEIVNNETVAVEDKVRVFLPFEQVFGGYGWGVAGKNVGDLDIEVGGITEEDFDKAVKKFLVKNDAVSSVANNRTLTLGQIFEAAADVNISAENIYVSVTPVDKTNTAAGGTFTANTNDWTQGVLSFTGTGDVEVRITDYDLCQVTIYTLTLTGPVDVEKFAVALPDASQTLYRVGNANAVALSSLFKALDGAEIGSVTVTVAPLNENSSAGGTYTANASDWTGGTIRFTGTGPVRVTIDDDDYARAVALDLEVVNAANVTAYSELGNRNSVLLNDITMSTGGSYYLSGATLYGNGFTFDMTNGTHTAGGNVSSNYVFGLTNANLDNVRVVGAVYTKYGATTQSDYNRAAILSSGSNTITNSYISNCASAVRVKDGKLEIINSTIKGGNFANIDIRGGNVVLDNVTTINQVNGNDTAADGTVVVGLGIVVYYENVLNTTTLEIKNGITQYNNLSKTQANTYITDTTAKKLTGAMYDSAYSAVQYNNGTDTWINTGILSMTSSVGDANISDVNGYVDAAPSMTGVTGYLHTAKPDAVSVAAAAPAYVSAGQGAIAPSCSFDYTAKNYVAKTDGSNDYCYEENGTVYISMDDGDTFDWDTSILTAVKNGQTLDYTVSMDGTDYTGKSITFSTAGSYTVTYTYTDTNNYMVDENGNITTYDKTYTKTVCIAVSVIKATTKHAEFTFGSSAQATEKITVGNNTYISAAGVSHDNTNWSYITVDGTKIYYPIVEATIVDKKIAYFHVFKDAVTITDYADGGTGNAVTYNASTTAMPGGLTVVKGTYKAFANISSDWSTLNDSALTYSGASNVFKYAASASASATPTTYSGALVFASPEVTNARDEYVTMVQYSYTDSTNTTYYYYVGYHMAEKAKATTCVTPDTLITLADGTQKEIRYVTGDDQLLVWNFYTGKYDAAPASIVMNHGYDDYTVTALEFDDGTVVKTITGHGFYAAEDNRFVILNQLNADEYLGRSFVKQDGNGYSTAKLVGYSVSQEYTESWSVLTAGHYNCILEGMLTLTPAEVEGSPEYLMPFEVNSKLQYKKLPMLADIWAYGQYTYDDFADCMTREQFEALGLANFKVSVGKGYITYDEIMELIAIHIG